MDRFAENMRRYRLQRNMTLDDLAALVGSTKQVLSRYETGHRVPKISMVKRICDALGVSLTDLTGDNAQDAMPPPVSFHTDEARMISAGIDKMPLEERKRAVELMELMFSKYYKGEMTHDARP